MDTRIRTCPEQFSIMIEFMETNGDISRPQQGAQGRIKADRLWEELTLILNSVGGGANRQTEKWKKVWADCKTKTKKKASVLSRFSNSTGGGPPIGKKLSNYEQRVLSIMGRTAVVGLSNIEERGFSAPPSENLNYGSVMLGPSPLIEVEEEVEIEVTPLVAPTAPSPSSDTANIRRRRAPRERRRITPFQSASEEFARIERRRLDLEEARDARSHELQLKWLEEISKFRNEYSEREKEKIAIEAEKVAILKNICAHVRDLKKEDSNN